MKHRIMKQRLETAALTLSQLPRPHLGQPNTRMAHWPDMLKHSVGISVDGHKKSKIAPNYSDLDDMYIINDALYMIDTEYRKLLWARACRLPWSLLQVRFSCSHTHLNQRHDKALTLLEAALGE